MPTRQVEVPDALGGERADKVLAALTGVSRSLARRLLEEGKVACEGVVLAPGRPVGAGRVLTVTLPEAGSGLVPEEIPFLVRYEDSYLAVVDKPAGVVVHPGAGRERGTLAAGILARWPQVRGVGEDGRWGIVHRLDRETSGLLVVGLTAEAWAALRAAINLHRVERTYLALVNGRPAAAAGTVDAPLGRHQRRRGLVQVTTGGRPARTHYRCLACWPEAGRSLLEVRLETGRTHQIRVHLAAIGLPVVGDPVYGRAGGASGRLFLHACRLCFSHPVTGEPIDVRSPLPADLQAVRDGLGEPAAPPGG